MNYIIECKENLVHELETCTIFYVEKQLLSTCLGWILRVLSTHSCFYNIIIVGAIFVLLPYV